MPSLNEWIDTKIKDEDINYFEYEEFCNVEKVGEGIVNRADWKSCGIKIALKILANNPSINEDNMKKFLKELKNLRKASFHPNINQFVGITKGPSSNSFMMVSRYANQGNLREYLKNNFVSLQWKDKIQMASDIAFGLKCLHSRKIIHRDLHAKNILVHNNKLMISNDGLSKQLTFDVASNPGAYGMPAYVDPQCFKNYNYVRDEKSDIYSLGVLLWEITSGYPPFSKVPTHTLIYKIANGIREHPIRDTPSAYVNLYQKCWTDDPNLRPTSDDVFDVLKKISLQFNNTNEKIDINNETNSDSINQNDSSKLTMNLSRTENQIEVVTDEREKFISIVPRYYKKGVVLSKRINKKKIYEGKYQGVGGGIEENEEGVEAAKREMEEETGLIIEKERFVRIMNDLEGEKPDCDCELYVVTLLEKKGELCKRVEPENNDEWKIYKNLDFLKLGWEKKMIPMLNKHCEKLFLVLQEMDKQEEIQRIREEQIYHSRYEFNQLIKE